MQAQILKASPKQRLDAICLSQLHRQVASRTGYSHSGNRAAMVSIQRWLAMLSGMGRSLVTAIVCCSSCRPPSSLCRLAGAHCLLFDSYPLSSTRCLGCWEETLSSFPRSPTHFNELAGSPAPHCPLASLPFSAPLRWLQAWPSFGQLPCLCCPPMASQIAWTIPPRFPQQRFQNAVHAPLHSTAFTAAGC